MNIPIFLAHKGGSFYLASVFKQIRLSNPGNRLCLIGDLSTAHSDFTICKISSWVNGKKVHTIGKRDLLEWKFSPVRLKSRYRELKKLFSSYDMCCMMVRNKMYFSGK